MQDKPEFIRTLLKECSEDEWALLFYDVKAFRETGIVPPDSALDRLTQYVDSHCDSNEDDGMDDTVVSIMNALLYLLAGEYIDMCSTDNQAELNGWEYAGKELGFDVYVSHNLEVPALWDYCVTAKYGPNLAYFRDERSAWDYIAKHGYHSVEGNKLIEYRNEDEQKIE